MLKDIKIKRLLPGQEPCCFVLLVHVCDQPVFISLGAARETSCCAGTCFSVKNWKKRSKKVCVETYYMKQVVICATRFHTDLLQRPETSRSKVQVLYNEMIFFSCFSIV